LLIQSACSSSSCSSSSSRSSSSESDDSAPAAGGILQILEFVTRDPALLQGNFKRFFLKVHALLKISFVISAKTTDKIWQTGKIWQT
jgi:hypothetical protein